MPLRRTAPDAQGTVNGRRDRDMHGWPGRNGFRAVPYYGLRISQWEWGISFESARAPGSDRADRHSTRPDPWRGSAGSCRSERADKKTGTGS
jgi:hypothetical protein